MPPRSSDDSEEARLRRAQSTPEFWLRAKFRCFWIAATRNSLKTSQYELPATATQLQADTRIQRGVNAAHRRNQFVQRIAGNNQRRVPLRSPDGPRSRGCRARPAMGANRRALTSGHLLRAFAFPPNAERSVPWKRAKTGRCWRRRQLERRSDLRYSVDEDSVVLFVGHGVPQEARLVDLSQMGCRLRTTEPVLARVRLPVEVFFNVDGISFRFRGVLQWTDGHRLIGVRFVNIIPQRMVELANIVCGMEKTAAVRAEAQRPLIC